MNQTIQIPVGGRQHLIPSEIMHLQASVNYTLLFLKNGKKLMVATPLKTLASRLEPFSFFRVHKSHLINLAYIKNICPYNNTIEMLDKNQFELARRRVTSFKKELKYFLND